MNIHRTTLTKRTYRN